MYLGTYDVRELPLRLVGLGLGVAAGSRSWDGSLAATYDTYILRVYTYISYVVVGRLAGWRLPRYVDAYE